MVFNVLKSLQYMNDCEYTIHPVESIGDNIVYSAYSTNGFANSGALIAGTPIIVFREDIFVSIDLYHGFNFHALSKLKSESGLLVYFIIHDLLDIRTEFLGEKDIISKIIARSARVDYINWLYGIAATADGIIGNSMCTKDEFYVWAITDQK